MVMCALESQKSPNLDQEKMEGLREKVVRDRDDLAA